MHFDAESDRWEPAARRAAVTTFAYLRIAWLLKGNSASLLKERRQRVYIYTRKSAKFVKKDFYSRGQKKGAAYRNIYSKPRDELFAKLIHQTAPSWLARVTTTRAKSRDDGRRHSTGASVILVFVMPASRRTSKCPATPIQQQQQQRKYSQIIALHNLKNEPSTHSLLLTWKSTFLFPKL